MSAVSITSSPLPTPHPPHLLGELSYLVGELSHHLIEPVGLLGEVLGLGEEVLRGLQRAISPGELVHSERHLRHGLGPAQDVVVLVVPGHLLPLVGLGGHLVVGQFHLQT